MNSSIDPAVGPVLGHRQPRANQSRSPSRVRALAPCALVLLLALSASCKNFQSTTRPDYSSFADQTIALLNRFDLHLRRDDGIYTRKYLDPDDPDTAKLRDNTERAVEVLRGMSTYSLEIVTISGPDDTEAEQVEAYRRYMQEFADELERSLDVDGLWFDDEIERVAASENLVEALRAAQPILDTAGREALLIADEAEEMVYRLAQKVEARIDERHADVIRYHDTVEQERSAILGGLEALHLTNLGDADAFQRIRDSHVVADRSLIPDGDPSQDDMAAIGDHLMKRLTRIGRIREVIQPDWQEYARIHSEFDDLVFAANHNINRYRITILVWLQGHRRMAAGVKNPAAWFDIDDAPGALLNVGTRAARF